MPDPATLNAEPRAFDTLQGKVADRFLVTQRLGRGAMGEVYRAQDTKLNRTVALKRMSPHLRADPEGRDRFVREAERASQVSDRNIAAIYDVNEDHGEIILVMEFVEGKTLRERLEQPVSLDDFLSIALQCASALAAAHSHGIVHFDVKPENIMLTSEGQIKMLDFGLAKHFPRPDESTLSVGELANVGGTIGYTAPEVICGQSLDERADLFSLGVVFYELLAGVRPFVSNTAMGVADKTLHSAPIPLRQLKPQIPLELERITSRLLQRDPAARYSSATELITDLQGVRGTTRHPWLLAVHFMRLHRRGWMISLAIILVTVTAVWLVRRGPPVPPNKNLAVLPFTAMSGDRAQTAFAYGLAEVLSAKLARISERHQLQVVAPGEVRAQQVMSAGQARQAFGANLVLEGSLRQSGNSVRVTYALVDSKSGRQLRADTITADVSDPFSVEDRVASSVLSSLEVELQESERQQFRAHGTAEPQAYDLYLQGRGYLQDFHKPENLESAIQVFQQALKRDPNYALAYAGLGEAYWHSYELSHERSWVENALAACQKSILLGRDNPAGHICLGTAFNGTGNYEQAAEQFRIAVKLNPSEEAAYRGLAAAYERLEKPADAENTYKEAIQLRPDYWGVYNYLGLFYWKQGRYREAESMFSKVVQLEPDNVRGYSNLGSMLLLQGRYQEAVPKLERSVAIRPNADVYSNLATAFFYLHRYDEAAHAYEEAARLDPHSYLIQGNLGDVYYWTLGRRADAMNAYRRAVQLATEESQVNPRDAYVLGDLARYEAMLGDRTAASQDIQRGLELSPNNPEVLFEAALVHNQFGQTAKTIEYLGKSLKAGYSVATIRDEPLLKNLHENARFIRLTAANNAK